MKNTYRAVEVTTPGVLNLVERRLTSPGPGQVRIRVETCGVCHTDGATVHNMLPGITFPRVPGHEVVGRIDEVGPGVTRGRLDSASVSATSEVMTAPAKFVFGAIS
jgi:alcohol dehydrogenase, propanol-preferring